MARPAASARNAHYWRVREVMAAIPRDFPAVAARLRASYPAQPYFLLLWDRLSRPPAQPLSGVGPSLQYSALVRALPREQLLEIPDHLDSLCIPHSCDVVIELRRYTDGPRESTCAIAQTIGLCRNSVLPLQWTMNARGIR